MPTFTDSFTGAISSYWDQYGSAWTANGTTVTGSSNATDWRLLYRVGDQAMDGDYSVKIVTKGAGTGKSGVVARWTDDAGTTNYSGPAVVYDATSATIKAGRYDASVFTEREDTLTAHADGDTIGIRISTTAGVTTLRALKNGVAIGSGVTDSTYTSGAMGIIDHDGHTYDDFSGPTNTATTMDAVRITHSDGSITDYQAIANARRARGKALIDALAAIVAGDELTRTATSTEFDTGHWPLNAAAGAPGSLVKIKLSGAIIYSQATFHGACITYNSYQEWHDFTIWCNTGQINGSPIGHRGTNPAAAAGSASNVLFSDVRGIGPVDCFHTTGGPLRVVNVRLVRCDLNSSFDTAIVIVNSCAAGSTVELVNCTALAQYPHSLYPPIATTGMGVTTRAVSCQDTDCIMTVYGGTYTCGGASSVNSAALVTLGTLNLFDCALVATGTNALSIQRTGGTLNYANVTLTGSTSGTITDLLTAYAPAPCTDLEAVGAGTGVLLKWTNNHTNATDIEVEYSTNPTFTGSTTLTLTDETLTSYVVPTLVQGQLYHFRVRATNGTGDSTNSNVASSYFNAYDGGMSFPGANMLTNSCSLKRNAPTQSATSAGMKPGWATIYTSVPCAVQASSARQDLLQMRETGSRIFTGYFPRNLDLRTGDRITAVTGNGISGLGGCVLEVDGPPYDESGRGGPKTARLVEVKGVIS